MSWASFWATFSQTHLVTLVDASFHFELKINVKKFHLCIQVIRKLANLPITNNQREIDRTWCFLGQVCQSPVLLKCTFLFSSIKMPVFHMLNNAAWCKYD
jgi:hypothetical protein